MKSEADCAGNKGGLRPCDAEAASFVQAEDDNDVDEGKENCLLFKESEGESV